MDKIELEQQVQQEQRELAAAPRVELVHNSSGRCHFCGAVTRNLIFVEGIGRVLQPDGSYKWEHERYRGEDCCNG